ncbi:MAG: hypothetical protein AABZ74_17335, partial [Cyanobacteriota bacterium]
MLKNFFDRLSEEKDLEKRFFRHASFYTSIISFLGLIVNALSGLGWLICLICLISGLFFYACF